MTGVDPKISAKLDRNINAIIKHIRTHYDNPAIKKDIKFSDLFSNTLLISYVIKEGVTYDFFHLISQMTPISEQDWADLLNLSTKTLQRYKEDATAFKPIHTEKILEMAEVSALGLDVFGDAEKFKSWLDAPNFALGSVKPLDLLLDSYGKALVMGELTRINYGILS